MHTEVSASYITGSRRRGRWWQRRSRRPAPRARHKRRRGPKAAQKGAMSGPSKLYVGSLPKSVTVSAAARAFALIAGAHLSCPPPSLPDFLLVLCRPQESDLEQAFRHYGRVRHTWVARNPPGFAYVVRPRPRPRPGCVRVRVRVQRLLPRPACSRRPSRPPAPSLPSSRPCRAARLFSFWHS